MAQATQPPTLFLAVWVRVLAVPRQLQIMLRIYRFSMALWVAMDGSVRGFAKKGGRMGRGCELHMKIKVRNF